MDTDTGQDKCSHDGVLLRKAIGTDHMDDFNTTGCLNIMQFQRTEASTIQTTQQQQQQQQYCKYAIEWRPNDGFLISDTDTQEQDEWSFVDTIAKRNRTISECLIFDTATNNISVKSSVSPTSSLSTTAAAAAATSSPPLAVSNNNNNAHNSSNNTHSSHQVGNNISPSNHIHSNNGSLCSSSSPSNGATSAAAVPKRNRNIRVRLNELEQIEVLRKGQIVRLITCGGKVHSEYLFQNGNADNFIRTLIASYVLVMTRTQGDRCIYDVVAPNGKDEDGEDEAKLKKTFAELQIDDIKSTRGWISNMVRRPYEQTIDMFAKIAVMGNIHSNHDPHHLGGSSTPSPTTPPSQPRHIQHSPKENHANIYNSSLARTSSGDMAQSTSAEDYELLSTSPRVGGSMLRHMYQHHQHNHQHHDGRNQIVLSQLLESTEGGSVPLPINKLPERILTPRSRPLSREDWQKVFAEDGSIAPAMVESLKRQIFEGGVEDEIRSEVWKYLLGYDLWTNSSRQKELRRDQKNSEYYIMKSQWLRMSAVQEENFSDYRDRKCQIQKDVKRTDRTHDFFAGEDNPNLETLYDILMTYVMYNFDLGYVQGMSDLLAPILYVMKNERDAFWCFVGFMDRVYRNFDIDQSGMKRQLQDLSKLIAFVNPRLSAHLKATDSNNMYFCFRWLLVWFKREFQQDDINTIWEVLWTGRPCANYHLFVSVAILDEQAAVIMDGNFEFNEILKHVNELSLRIDVSKTLMKAEAIYHQVVNASHLTDDIRTIMGIEVADVATESGDYDKSGRGGNADDNNVVVVNDEDDQIDQMKVASPVKSFEEEERRQKKIEEALEQSMYFGFY